MTDHDSDDKDLARLRKLFDDVLLRGELPKELQFEDIQVDETDRARAEKLMPFVLREDLDGLREASLSSSALVGMNRGSASLPEESIPELDEARERVRRRRRAKGGSSEKRDGN